MAIFAMLMNYGKNIFAVPNLYESSTMMNKKIFMYFLSLQITLKLPFLTLKWPLATFNSNFYPKMAVSER